MRDQKLPPTIILDFDSTIVSVETIELLAEQSLMLNPNRPLVLADIERLTQQAMAGEIGFHEALQERLRLVQLKRSHVETVAIELLEKITPSFLANKDFLIQNQKNIFIISGGFTDCIVPVALALGILPGNIYANTFLYNTDGVVLGVDPKNPLSQNGGKVTQVGLLQEKMTNPIHAIGDGMTDFEMEAAGVVDSFFAFTEIISRPAVLARASRSIKSFNEYIVMH